MDGAAAHAVTQRGVDHAMFLQQALAAEGRRHHIGLEVGSITAYTRLAAGNSRLDHALDFICLHILQQKLENQGPGDAGAATRSLLLYLIRPAHGQDAVEAAHAGNRPQLRRHVPDLEACTAAARNPQPFD